MSDPSDATTFLDLNDDCILEILSVKSLSAQDLCRAAETCRRLKEIARRVFKREYKKCDLHALCGKNTKKVERILKNFGPEISDLVFDVDDDFQKNSIKWSSKILASVTEHCNVSTLQSLHLHDLRIPENITAKLRPLFKNLQKLTLMWCTFEGAGEELFADCKSLVQLVLGLSNKNDSLVLKNTFPKLQQFEFNGRADLESFISRHMGLKSLKLLQEYGKSSLFQLIAALKQLETLQCFIECQNAKLDLTNLGHLRELFIGCDERMVSETALGLENLQFLEHVTIWNAIIDSEFIRTVAQLKRLQALKLDRCHLLDDACMQIFNLHRLTILVITPRSWHNNDLDIALLVQRLSKLNYLILTVSRFEMDLEMYRRIVDVMRQRPDRSKLTLLLVCEMSDVDFYENLIPHFLQNAHLVEVIIDPHYM